MTDIRDRIRNIIAEQAMLDVEQVTDDSSPADLMVTDMEAEFLQDLTDALVRVVPEGFRNRRNIMTKDSFFFVAAEESIKPELISEIEEKIREMENA